MRWLFAPQLRPLVLLAAVASLFLNLALVVPAIYMVQVFDRVFTSRSEETLAMLSLFVVLALALGYCMDVARARALSFAGRVLDARLSPATLRRALLRAAGPTRIADADALRDVAQLLIAGWKTLIDARGAWQRLNAREDAHENATPLALPVPQGRLELQRVVFGGLAQRPALIKGVSFALEAGESLALVGPSAAGKTTLIRLILGIWRPQAGTVRLDGADIAQWDRDALGAHIGYLPQDVEIFAGTVAENIARLGEVDAEQVVVAARLAHAHDMILALPQGYDTPIGEAGAVLSGGQRQRIALARAVYGAPRLVVLDEPNANLDAEGDAALLAALRDLKARGTTVILVSHRPAAMAQLDKIAVLKDGALAHFGSADTLRAQLQSVGRTAPSNGRPQPAADKHASWAAPTTGHSDHAASHAPTADARTAAQATA